MSLYTQAGGVMFPQQQLPPFERSKVETLRLRISKECTVAITLDGDVTQQAVTKLIQYLELVKDGYPIELSTPASG